MTHEITPHVMTTKPQSIVAVDGIHGGAVYDALVGAAAAEHDAVLVTRDQRAVPTYRAVGAAFRLLV